MEQKLSDQVYHIVKQIPSGKVMTYGQLASAVGRPRAARLIGVILSHTPAELRLPCHRVVNRFGGLAPDDIFGGPGIQRFLLESEGVLFLENGCVNLSCCLWKKDFIN